MSRVITFCIAALVALTTPAIGQEKSQAQTGKKVVVKLSTNLGDMFLELDAEKAPITVDNFLAYAKSGHFEGTIFHRVMKGFMAQGGGFLPDYSKKEVGREAIRNEADNGLKNNYGTVAMARTPDPHSATAQFFINCKDNEFLNHKSKEQREWGYCVFGKVIAGTATLEKIASTKVIFDRRADQGAPARPVEAIVIKRVAPVDGDDKEIAAAKKADAEFEAEAAAALAAAEKIKKQAFAFHEDAEMGKTSDSGLRYLDIKVGEGEAPKDGGKVTVHYTGWLVKGKKFDSSRDRGEPIKFGLGQVIKGWGEGVASMKVGGKRILVIPPALGYRDQNIGDGLIPPNSTLIFEVELVEVD